VRLEGNAHLVQGFDSFSGGILNYNIKKDKMARYARKKHKYNRKC
jgi:glutamate mutase epsilon subunit